MIHLNVPHLVLRKRTVPVVLMEIQKTKVVFGADRHTHVLPKLTTRLRVCLEDVKIGHLVVPSVLNSQRVLIVKLDKIVDGAR